MTIQNMTTEQATSVTAVITSPLAVPIMTVAMQQADPNLLTLQVVYIGPAGMRELSNMMLVFILSVVIKNLQVGKHTY